MNENWDRFSENVTCGKPVEMRFHNNIGPVNETIRNVLNQTLVRYGRKELTDHMNFYTATLVHHAEKENVKNAFFLTNHINPMDMGHYVQGIIRFRSIDGKKEYFEFYDKLKDLDLWIDLKLDHCSDGMCLEITNNTPLPDIEEMWLRVKLKKAMMYNQLMKRGDSSDENLDFGDPGIGVIAIMMQKAKLDARLFRVGSKEGKSFSRIEIPFTEDYTPVRRYIRMDA